MPKIKKGQNKNKANTSNVQKVVKVKGPPPTIKREFAKTGKDELMQFMSNINMAKPAESAGEILGKKLGMFAGRLLGRITGSGDYQTNLPPGGLPIEETMVPQFIKSENSRETRIRHREFVGNVYASSVAGAFLNTSYAFNPGNALMFPWLATIAQHYDQWEPHGAVIIFKTLTSTYAASQSLGTVVIASDYDVYDPSYNSKVDMANSEFAVSGNAAQSLMHPIECNAGERMTKVLTVGNGLYTAVDNKRFFDLANVQIASEGCLANQLLGELWVTYDLSFYKPQIPLDPGGLMIAHQFYTANLSLVNNPFGGVLQVSPYGTPDLLSGIGSNYIRFSDKYVGYYFLVQVRGITTFGAAANLTWTYTGVTSSNAVNPIFSLALQTTPLATIAGGSSIYQTLVRIDPTADGIHLMTVATSPQFDLGAAGNWRVGLSIDQINPKAFNYLLWAGLP